MSEVLKKALEKLGLVRDIDLVLHLPLRYEDETRIIAIAATREGQTAQIEATVVDQQVQLSPRRQLVVQVEDASGSCTLRFLNFYPYQQKSLAVGKRLRIRGEVRGGFWGRQMLHPQIKAAEGNLPAALTPVYPTSRNLPQAYLRRVIATALQRVTLPETLPPQAPPPPFPNTQVAPMRTWSLHEALHFLHHPTPDVALATLEDKTHPAWQRLKAEELLAQQLSQYKLRQARAQLVAPVLKPHTAPAGTDAPLPLHEQLLGRLPFALTAAQRRVCEEIALDIARPTPMHRLLQGDVGSGKTVVAAISAAIGMDAGWQCALMAPTEILAEQHFRKLTEWLNPLLAERGQSVAWLVGAQKKKQRQQMLQAIADGTAALVVGTHAIIQEHVQFARLGLVLIDEQHRFGVAQRLSLRRHDTPAEAETAAPIGAGMEPHMLMMTATPIPRTLAMTYYADLSVSTIDELPPGRTPIVTRLIAEHRRDELIERLARQIAQGRQAYWVCPLIEESEALDLSNATATYETLGEAMPHARLGLLHSRMSGADKQAVMTAFAAGDIHLLVATTVIEVGVDVPNASLMIVEHAERFGLSQLHQLRGRVGRGSTASACILLYATNDHGKLSDTAKERLQAMAQTNDGFEIARRDLEIRGPGEFMGARQSGAALLRFADLATDQNLLEWARTLAPQMLQHDPALAEAHMARWLGGKWDYLKA